MDAQDLSFLGCFDAVDRDPRRQFTSFAFLVEMSKRPTVTPKTDAKACKWFPLDDLPDLAFDHEDIIFLAKKIALDNKRQKRIIKSLIAG